MKKLLVSSLLLVGMIQQSHADIIASMANKVGGRIDLYNNSIPTGAAPGCDGKYIAKAWGNSLPDTYGCWVMDGDLISVKWVGGDGSYRSYPMTSFTPRKKASGSM